MGSWPTRRLTVWGAGTSALPFPPARCPALPLAPPARRERVPVPSAPRCRGTAPAAGARAWARLHPLAPRRRGNSPKGPSHSAGHGLCKSPWIYHPFCIQKLFHQEIFLVGLPAFFYFLFLPPSILRGYLLYPFPPTISQRYPVYNSAYKFLPYLCYSH